jgi:hypothetical protein
MSGLPWLMNSATNALRIIWRLVASSPQLRLRLLLSPLSSSHHTLSGSSQQMGLSRPQPFCFCSNENRS